jgi:hypothetical protein
LEKSIILIVKYDEASDDITQKAIQSFTKILATQNSSVDVAYCGSDNKIIATLKSMLDMAK